MKKVWLILLFLSIIVSVAHANPDRYKIFMEKAGFWGGSSFMMVNTETGQSWKYNGRMWEPIPRIEEEATGQPDISVLMTKHEEEVRALNLKQAEEIRFLNAKHERELAELKARLDLALRPKPVKKAVVYRSRSAKPEAVKADDADNTPPAWLSDE